MKSATALAVGFAAANAVNALPFTIPYLDRSGRLEVQGHRGGLGMRTEESLWVTRFPSGFLIRDKVG